MIVPMKKAAVIVQAKDAGSALKRLRGLGIIHVEHQHPPKGKDIAALGEDLTLLNEATGILSEKGLLKNAGGNPPRNPDGWQFSARHIIDLRKRLDHLEEYSRALVNQIGQWERWGDFDPGKINALAEKGIYLRLYQIPVKEIAGLPENAVVRQLHIAGGIASCVVISPQKLDIPYKEIPPPKAGLAKMRQRLGEDLKTIEQLKLELSRHIYLRKDFLRLKNSLENELEFHQALEGMGQAGEISYLTGYIPADGMVSLSEIAKKEKWGLLLADPLEEDNVPTLIRNPKWISVINPVFKLLEVAPGYRELDISLPFLIFFSTFFGMLIGDAGYGTIYLLLTFWAERKFGRKTAEKSYFRLFYILSSCAIGWGLLTGTIFGQEWLLKAGFKPLMPALNEAKKIQAFCFFLGALHLTIAHSWRAILKAPSLSALADAGWICVLWAAFLLARVLILGDNFPHFGKWLVISGIGAVILFTNPQKNILKGIGEGLGTLALSLMNNFTDVVSYVRLFAVGLAGVAIADTFNAMAAGVGSGNFLAVLLSGVIILAGHGLNLILGPMSVLVHGVRLNVLEFSGHANITWSGIAYRPLKE